MPLLIPVNGLEPQMGDNCYLAENSTIVGDVVMGDNCSVWFSAVVRGDVHSIRMGDNCNIQDGAVIHCTYERCPTSLGNNVSVGHNAIVHGCTIEDNVLIGMGAIVMDRVVVKKNSIIAAGAIVLEGTVVEEGSVFAGVPAKKVKEISTDNEELFTRTARNYIKYAGWFKEK